MTQGYSSSIIELKFELRSQTPKPGFFSHYQVFTYHIPDPTCQIERGFSNIESEGQLLQLPLNPTSPFTEGLTNNRMVTQHSLNPVPLESRDPSSLIYLTAVIRCI